ncbi:MAG: four helix bundle protein [Chitinophagaceae bacterium]|nr:MAG: four helix bundle protein [Chitinophagaceae bacterium]
MNFKFEKLTVWQKALDLSEHIDSLAKAFPADEKFILGSQIKRAADSISLNIAEGSTGQSNAEFSRFLKYSLRSIIEVVACLHIAKRRKYLDEVQFSMLEDQCLTVLKMVNALIYSMKVKVTS